MMIKGLSHIGVWVLDQDAALDFYVGKLGFKVHTDARADGYRWLTVTPPEQPDLQVVLSVPGPPAIEPEAAEQIKSLVSRGQIGGGILTTDDCRRAYEELSARGVEFIQEPTETFYGVDSSFRDPSGNHWRLVQHPPNPPREFPV